MAAKMNTTPNPDPTVLTTQQIYRENMWLREVLETRLDGMDTAIRLLREVGSSNISLMISAFSVLLSVGFFVISLLRGK